jgi:hypothetical protein
LASMPYIRCPPAEFAKEVTCAEFDQTLSARTARLPLSSTPLIHRDVELSPAANLQVSRRRGSRADDQRHNDTRATQRLTARDVTHLPGPTLFVRRPETVHYRDVSSRLYDFGTEHFWRRVPVVHTR